MDRGDHGEPEHHPQHGHEDVEREARAEQHEPLETLHDATSRRQAQGLGLGALVGDEHRHRHHRDHQHREA